MEQAHTTGCLNSELRFERDKKPISEGREAPWGERSPPPVTSQSIQYLRLHQSTVHVVRGGGGAGNIEGLWGSQES